MRTAFRGVLGVSLAFALNARAEGQTPPIAQDQCAVNVVFGTFMTGGYVGASGFAFDAGEGAPVRKVDMVLDGGTVGDVSLMGYRPDVSSHFARPAYLWSGWNGSFSLEGVAPGPHTLQMVAIDREGNQTPCDTRTIEVLPGPSLPQRPASAIGLEIIVRTFSFLAWAALVGWAPAFALGVPRPLLSSPFFGLALFGIFAEIGGALHVRPSRAAAALTLVSIALFVWFLVTRRIRVRLPSRQLRPVALFVVLFAAVGVLPLASHGEGAVLGTIDDASRECVVADSISRFGWRVPSDVQGYAASMPNAIQVAHVRPGGIYLLSALADTFAVRAHEVHSVAMLATGCLIVWGAWLLASTLPMRGRRRGWLAAALAALNSTLIATLYGQHLGSLLGAALLLPFVAFLFPLAASGSFRRVLAVAILIAAGLVFYPEALALWVVTAILAVAWVRGARRRTRAAVSLVLAAVLSVALNPIGIARFVRFAGEESQKMTAREERALIGDTHYFPSPTVVWGIEAYREDARAPLGRTRGALIPLTAVMILATVLLGWLRASRRERVIVLALLLPAALALFANVWLNFPYGYSKFLPSAAAVWSVAFPLLAARAAEPSASQKGRVRAAIATVSFVLVLALALPSVRHVVRRALRSVPAYDSAYRVLPALAAAVGRDATIIIDEPVIASREWIRYFVSDNAVIESSDAMAPGGSRRYRLFDRRRAPAVINASVSSRVFALVPAGGRP